MNLSLSVRIAESFHSKTEASLDIVELIDAARTIGFPALCMRASQAGVDTPKERREAIARAIRDAGLSVSMITGDFYVPQNNADGPSGLRHITPYLDLADGFDADLIRVCMKEDNDIEWARRAADEARERGIRLAHQSHFGSLFETVASSLDVLRAVGRENFGLIYEAANWLICGEDYVAAIRKLAPWIFNVYVQNHRVCGPGEEGDDHVDTWKHGRVEVDHIGIWEQGGVDAPRVFEELRAVEYAGYVTVHQAFEGVMSPVDAARLSHEYLSAQLLKS